MLPRYAPMLICAAALFRTSFAQSTASVPTDLSSAFDANSISLQVSYNSNSADGFKDGTKFSSQDTLKAPSFALGDSSGVNTAISFLILLVDTTSLSNRSLHFLQTDFKADGEKTAISSKAQPAVPYRGPGSFAETGSRQYSFLMYQQTGKAFSVKNLPATGATFDVQKFQSDNGLKAPVAGKVMVVDLGGAGPSAPSASSTSQTKTQGSSAPATPSPSSNTQPSSSLPPSSAASTSAVSTTSQSTISSISSSKPPVVVINTLATSTTTVVIPLSSVISASASSSTQGRASQSSSLIIVNTPTGNAGASVTSSSATGLPTVTGSGAPSQLDLRWRAMQLALGAVGVAWFMI